jgi:hypothetical protein
MSYQVCRGTWGNYQTDGPGHHDVTMRKHFLSSMSWHVVELPGRWTKIEVKVCKSRGKIEPTSFQNRFGGLRGASGALRGDPGHPGACPGLLGTRPGDARGTPGSLAGGPGAPRSVRKWCPEQPRGTPRTSWTGRARPDAVRRDF